MHPPGVQVFRLSIHPKPSPDAEVICDTQPTAYRARRAHRKSRGGCLGCKKKRKKCDENRPRCTACEKRHLECRYADDERQKTTKNKKELVPKSISNDARLSFTTPAVLLAAGNSTKHDLYLLDFFVKSIRQQFDAKAAHVYTSTAITLAQEKPYLMHAAIAQAACQINYLCPNETKYRNAEAFHIQLASRGLRDAVASINGLKDSDAVLTASMLINGIAFCAAEYREDEKRAPPFRWLRVQLGLAQLLAITAPFHPESMWRWMFDASNAFQILEPPTNDLGQQIGAFCGVTMDTSEEESIYAAPCQWLEAIVTRPPHKQYLLLYTRFIGSITNAFVDLLEERDEKALMIFAHWLALICSIDEWWSVRRARRECFKICDHLMGRLKGAELELLMSPAMACGYL